MNFDVVDNAEPEVCHQHNLFIPLIDSIDLLKNARLSKKLNIEIMKQSFSLKLPIFDLKTIKQNKLKLLCLTRVLHYKKITVFETGDLKLSVFCSVLSWEITEEIGRSYPFYPKGVLKQLNEPLVWSNISNYDLLCNFNVQSPDPIYRLVIETYGGTRLELLQKRAVPIIRIRSSLIYKLSFNKAGISFTDTNETF